MNKSYKVINKSCTSQEQVSKVGKLLFYSGWVVPHSCDNKAISTPSWGLAGWLGQSWAKIKITHKNGIEEVWGTTRCVNSNNVGQIFKIYINLFIYTWPTTIGTIFHHPVQLVIIQHHLVPLRAILYHSAPIRSIRYHKTPYGSIQHHTAPLCTIGYQLAPLCTVHHCTLLCTIGYH